MDDYKRAGDVITKMFENFGKEVERKPAICEKHGEYEAVTTIGISGRPWDYGCPECSREDEEAYQRKEKEREAKDQREREAEAERERIRKIRAMGIEPAYDNSTLSSFVAETQEQKHNAERVQNLIDGAVKKLIMLGPNGTGKTHLACAAVMTMGGKIMTMYEISAEIRSSYRGDGEDELSILDRLSRYPLLVIDEIGRTKGSETEANWLSYIIDKRHVRGLPIILISNKHALKHCEKKGCNNCIENYFGEDVMSRLHQDGALLRFSGNDYRKMAGKTGKPVSKIA